MEGIDQATASSAIRVRIGDHEVEARVPSMKAIGHLRACLTRLPKPHDLDAMREEMKGLPAEVSGPVLAEAAQENKDWPPSIVGGGMLHFVDNVDLYPEFLVAALAGQYPGISLKNVPESRKVAEEILDTITFQDYLTLFEVAFDVKVRGARAEEGDADPKGVA